MNPLIQITDNPETHSRRLRYNFHPGQRQAWDAQARFVLVLAGSQSGKTCFTPLWLHREIQKQPLCTKEGEADYPVSSSTFDLLNLKLRPAIVDFFCRVLQGSDGPWGRFEKSTMMIHSNYDSSRIIFRSAENPESLESATGAAAVLDEYGQSRVPIEAWEAIQRRLSINEGRCLITTTPYTIGWLKQQVYDRAKGGDPDYAIVTFSSITNPSFPRKEYDRAKRTLPPWKFAMFYDGVFTQPAGLIYTAYLDTFAPEGHLLPATTPIPAYYPRYLGLDFGGTEHAGVLYLAEEHESPTVLDPLFQLLLREDGIELPSPAESSRPTGRYIIYDESLGQGKTTQDHADDILSKNLSITRIAGGAKSENSQREEWQKHHIPVMEPLISDVEAGIDRVFALFREKRLLVRENCHGLRSELGTYSRVLDASGAPTLQIADKSSFHRLDMLRAIASFIPYDPPAADQPNPEAAALAKLSPRSMKRLLAEKKRRQEEEAVIQSQQTVVDGYRW